MRTRWKRPLDFVLLGVASLTLLPMGFLIALCIVLFDGGEVFFRQMRVGVGRKPFFVLKFRTMRAGSVTRVGAWLRKSGLDEIPQAWNILLGEMSFCGPRPLTPGDVARLGWHSAKHDFRWSALPGMTGLAQIHAGGSARRSLAADRLALRRKGLKLELGILGVTALMNAVGKSRIGLRLRSPARQRRASTVNTHQ
jgi:lipopolysaccharide/colanic/teichoic acid biosynthesis glycosyltransferase